MLLEPLCDLAEGLYVEVVDRDASWTEEVQTVQSSDHDTSYQKSSLLDLKSSNILWIVRLFEVFPMTPSVRLSVGGLIGV